MKIARDCTRHDRHTQRHANTVGGWGLKVSGGGEKWRHATHENPTLFRFQFAAPQRRVNSFQKEFFTWSWVAPGVFLALLTKESRNWRFFRWKRPCFSSIILIHRLFFFFLLFIYSYIYFSNSLRIFFSQIYVQQQKGEGIPYCLADDFYRWIGSSDGIECIASITIELLYSTWSESFFHWTPVNTVIPNRRISLLNFSSLVKKNLQKCSNVTKHFYSYEIIKRGKGLNRPVSVARKSNNQRHSCSSGGNSFSTTPSTPSTNHFDSKKTIFGVSITRQLFAR